MDPECKIPVPRSFNTAKPYLIQLRNIFSGVSNGSGLLAGSIPFDPSVTLGSPFGSVAIFDEWKSVAALFGRIKLKEFTISMTPAYIDETKGDTFGLMALCSNASGTIVTPSTYDQIADNADSVIWNPIRDQSGVAKVHSFRPRGLGWASTATPGGVTGLGCPGQFLILASSLPNSSTILTFKLVGTYLVDNRT